MESLQDLWNIEATSCKFLVKNGKTADQEIVMQKHKQIII
jgi:hypothetical protein